MWEEVWGEEVRKRHDNGEIQMTGSTDLKHAYPPLETAFFRSKSGCEAI